MDPIIKGMEQGMDRTTWIAIPAIALALLCVTATRKSWVDNLSLKLCVAVFGLTGLLIFLICLCSISAELASLVTYQWIYPKELLPATGVSCVVYFGGIIAITVAFMRGLKRSRPTAGTKASDGDQDGKHGGTPR